MPLSLETQKTVSDRLRRLGIDPDTYNSAPLCEQRRMLEAAYGKPMTMINNSYTLLTSVQINRDLDSLLGISNPIVKR